MTQQVKSTDEIRIGNLEKAITSIFKKMKSLEVFNKFLLTNLIENCAQTSGTVDYLIANQDATLDELSFHSEMARDAIIEEVFKDGVVNPDGLAITKLSKPPIATKVEEPAKATPAKMELSIS
jgi:hypothetical protein